MVWTFHMVWTFATRREILEQNGGSQATLGRGAQVMWSKVALAQQLCCPQKGPLKHSMRSGLVGNSTATPIGIFFRHSYRGGRGPKAPKHKATTANQSRHEALRLPNERGARTTVPKRQRQRKASPKRGLVQTTSLVQISLI